MDTEQVQLAWAHLRARFGPGAIQSTNAAATAPTAATLPATDHPSLAAFEAARTALELSPGSPATSGPPLAPAGATP
jgi:hypothetical protein